jgi:hypothetical protein
MAGTNFDPIEITRLFVFGKSPPSSNNYNEHIRASDAKPVSIPYDMPTFMNSGGGRFAYPSLFSAVEKFFNGDIPDRENGYTAGEIDGILGLTSNDLRTNISQYGTGIGSDDHFRRSWIFGNSPFELDVSKATFYVNNDIKKIEGLEVRALADNFDFQSQPGAITQRINELINTPTFDPYNLNRGEVTIRFDGSGKPYPTYTEKDFQAHQKLEKEVNRPTQEGLGSIASSGIADFVNMTLQDPFLSYRRDSFKVIYGTPGDDPNLRSSDSIAESRSQSYLIVGGAGDDILSGREFNDELDGGEGFDTAVYKYRIYLMAPNESVTGFHCATVQTSLRI